MPAGRPTIMTEQTIQVLEAAFSVGASDLEACFLANISKSTLYNYQNENPEFLERKEMLKNMPNYKAKKLIVQKIEEGDEKQANWWLERKGKDEGFSLRTEMTGADGKDLPVPILGVALDNKNDYVSNDNSNKKDHEHEKADSSDTGWDVSEQDNQHSALLDSLSTD